MEILILVFLCHLVQNVDADCDSIDLILRLLMKVVEVDGSQLPLHVLAASNGKDFNFLLSIMKSKFNNIIKNFTMFLPLQ